jgi:hypothetical protein
MLSTIYLKKSIAASTYVDFTSAQTITGEKTFNDINILNNATFVSTITDSKLYLRNMDKYYQALGQELSGLMHPDLVEIIFRISSCSRKSNYVRYRNIWKFNIIIYYH